MVDWREEILNILTAPINKPGGIKLACKRYREITGCTWKEARRQVNFITEQHLIDLYGEVPA